MSTTAKAENGIPTEILILIIQKLGRPELAVCARASSLFYNLVTPLIYRSLRVNLHNDINPLFIRKTPVKKPSAADSLMSKLAAAFTTMSSGDVQGANQGGHEAKGMSYVFHSGEGQKYPSSTITFHREPRPNPFGFTTHLIISTHSHKICDNLPPLIMPHLRELKIQAGFQRNDLDFCECRHYTHDNGRCTKSTTCLCPLIYQLRPLRLVIGSTNSGLTGSALGLTNSNFPYPPQWVKELVIFAGASTGLEIGPQCMLTWLDKIPPTVERLSIVMQPRSEEEGSDGRWRYRRVAAFEGDISAEFLWQRLGMGLSGNAVTMEMVGIETIDRDWSELPVKLEEAEVRKAVEKKLVSKGWASEAAKVRANGIRFISRGEFDARGATRAGIVKRFAGDR